MQELPDALPTLGDFAKKQRHEGPISHWQKPTSKTVIPSPQEHPIFSKLTARAQRSFDGTLARMQLANVKCKFLNSSSVGLHKATMDKALEAFRAGRNSVPLSDGRMSGELGVSKTGLQKLAEPEGWVCDMVREKHLVHCYGENLLLDVRP